MVYQQKNAHSNLPSIGRFYANETPRTDDFYCQKTLGFSRCAQAHTTTNQRLLCVQSRQRTVALQFENNGRLSASENYSFSRHNANHFFSLRTNAVGQKTSAAPMWKPTLVIVAIVGSFVASQPVNDTGRPISKNCVSKFKGGTKNEKFVLIE